MHVLRGLRGARVAQCLSQLWRRFRSQTHQTVEELEGDNYLGEDPASTTVKHRPVELSAHHTFSVTLRTIESEKR